MAAFYIPMQGIPTSSPPFNPNGGRLGEDILGVIDRFINGGTLTTILNPRPATGVAPPPPTSPQAPPSKFPFDMSTVLLLGGVLVLVVALVLIFARKG